eukprot:GDKJ01028374.1.p1 GENE.GDKJ01028374.1~~GDKJ01028374.1.p1  ORF type:complete len:392 (-),score=71.77 GDKJ01028374.1:124-1299(-)
MNGLDEESLLEWQWKAIMGGDYDLLRRWEKGGENYNTTHETYGTPLCRAIENYIFCGPLSNKSKYLGCLNWLLERGASPLYNSSKQYSYSISYRKRDAADSEPTKRVETSGKNCLEISLELRDSIPSTYEWADERKRAKDVIDLLSRFMEEERNPKAIATVPIAEHVVSFWEEIFENSRFHNVEIDCRPSGEIIKSHECLLRSASPFFDALLSHTTGELSKFDNEERVMKRVSVDKCSAQDLNELLSLSFTGSWRCSYSAPASPSADFSSPHSSSGLPSLKKLCELTALANRFLMRCSSLLQAKLTSCLTVGNFEPICQFAIESNVMEGLKTKCLVLAAKSPEIEARFFNKGYVASVQEFLSEVFSSKDDGSTSNNGVIDLSPKRKRSRIL